MKSRFLKLMKSLDITTNNDISFKTGNESFGTIMGGVMTVGLAILYLVLNWTITFDFLLRLNPSLNQKYIQIPTDNQEMIDLSKEKQKLDFKVGIINLNENKFDFDKYFKINAYFKNSSNNDDFELELQNCPPIPEKKIENINKKKLFINEVDQREKDLISINRLFCINQNITSYNNSIFENGFKLGGSLEQSNSLYISVIISPCESSSNKICATNDEYFELFTKYKNKIFVFTSFPSFTIVNTRDLSAMQIYSETNFFNIDYNFTQIISFPFEQSRLETTSGILLEGEFVEKGYKALIRDKSYAYRSNHKLDNYVTIDIRYSYDYTKYLRKFIKIEDFLGVLGGTFQIFIYGVTVFMKIYNENCYYLNMIKHTNHYTKIKTFFKDKKQQKKNLKELNTKSVLERISKTSKVEQFKEDIKDKLQNYFIKNDLLKEQIEEVDEKSKNTPDNKSGNPEITVINDLSNRPINTFQNSAINESIKRIKTNIFKNAGTKKSVFKNIDNPDEVLDSSIIAKDDGLKRRRSFRLNSFAFKNKKTKKIEQTNLNPNNEKEKKNEEKEETIISQENDSQYLNSDNINEKFKIVSNYCIFEDKMKVKVANLEQTTIYHKQTFGTKDGEILPDQAIEKFYLQNIVFTKIFYTLICESHKYKDRPYAIELEKTRNEIEGRLDVDRYFECLMTIHLIKQLLLDKSESEKFENIINHN